MALTWLKNLMNRGDLEGNEVKSHYMTGQQDPVQNSSVARNFRLTPYSFAGRFGWVEIRNEAAWRYYKSLSVIRDAVDLGAECFTTVPFCIYDTKTEETYRESDSNNPVTEVLQLLNKPNQDISGAEFKRSHYCSYSVTGESFVLTTHLNAGDTPSEVYYINPSCVSDTTDSNERVIFFHVNNGMFKGKYQRAEDSYGNVYFEDISKTKRLWQIKTFNPDQNNQGRGLSKLSSVYYEIEQLAGVSKHNNALLRNGVRPSGAVVPRVPEGETASQLTDEQVEGLKQSIQSFYGGYNNSGNVMVLDGIEQFIELSQNNKDMEFNALVDMVKRQILNIFNIPLPLKNGENQTYSNFMESKYMLYDLNVIPFACSYASEMTRFLIPMYDNTERYIIKPDLDKIPAMEVKKLSKIERFKDATTINEVREFLNLPEIENGDSLMGQSNLVPAMEDLSKSEMVSALMDKGFTQDEAEEKAGLIYGCH